MQKVNCKSEIRFNSDFENYKYFLREYQITIIDVIQRQGKETSQIFIYKGKPFNIINFYGEMFVEKSEMHFDFEGRKAYKISNEKYLMCEQPTRWCGLANQFDFFQIVDLKKMEIIQFADKDLE